MMVVPFRPDHLDLVTLQPAQAYLRANVSRGHAEFAATHPSFSGFVGDEIVGCAGILPCWENRALAWSWIGAAAGRHMVAITRAVRQFLDAQPYRRVEITVDVEFDAGHRWAEMLGFRLEAVRMKAFRPDGGDSSLYARVRA
jgi:RimJ/RimL family protein N-acetyltransferase